MIENLRVAYPYFTSITAFDPQNIQTNAEANLARNLYSRLIEFDAEGNVQPSLASSVFVDGGVITLSIRNHLHTVDGLRISAEDVVNTLMMIVKKDSTTHGSLKELLGITRNDDLSTFIWSKGDNVFMRPLEPSNVVFIVPLLASTDYSILPKKSLVQLSDSKIADFRNTSGIYFVERDSSDGKLVLRINPNHFDYSVSAPQSIELVPAYRNKALDLFVAGEVDFITTINSSSTSEISEIQKKIPGARTRETLGIRLLSLRTTEIARARHTPEQLLYAGEKIRQALLEADTSIRAEEITDQLFPSLGEGHLSDDMLKKLRKRKQEVLADQNNAPKKPYVVAVGVSELAKYKSMYSSLPFVEVKAYEKAPWVLPPEDQPDGYLIDADSSFFESYSLLSYNFARGYFGSPDEGRSWLRNYVSTGDKQRRIKALQELHLSILQNGLIVPVVFAKYHIVIRSPFDFEISKFYAGTKLWKIHRQQ